MPTPKVFVVKWGFQVTNGITHNQAGALAINQQSAANQAAGAQQQGQGDGGLGELARATRALFIDRPGNVLSKMASYLECTDVGKFAGVNKATASGVREHTAHHPVRHALSNFYEVHSDALEEISIYIDIIDAYLGTLDSDILFDAEFIRHAVKRDSALLGRDIYEGNLNDDLIFSALCSNPQAGNHVPIETLQNPALALRLIETFSQEKMVELFECLRCFPEEVGDAPEVRQAFTNKFRDAALEKLSQDAEFAQSATSYILGFDWDYIFQAAQITPEVLGAVRDGLETSKSLNLALLNTLSPRSCMRVMEYLHGSLEDDTDILEAYANKIRPLALADLEDRTSDTITASEFFAELTFDKPYMLAVVAQNPSLIQYAEAPLDTDLELAEAVVMEDGLAIQHCSDAIKDTKSIALIAVGNNPDAREHLSARLQDDLDILSVQYAGFLNELL